MIGYDPYMGFGKFKNRRLSTLPTSYLTWLLEEVDMAPYFDKAVQIEVMKRLQRHLTVYRVMLREEE